MSLELHSRRSQNLHRLGVRGPWSVVRSRRPRGFTLIEIMIVVGIMALILTIGVPIVYKIWHRAPMVQALRDVAEVLSNARREAILHGHEVDIVFHPREGRLEVGGGIGGGSGTQVGAGFNLPAEPGQQSAPPPARSGYIAQLDGRILIEMLDINKFPHDFRDDDTARVRFFPNGTCDELTLILVSDHLERREIKLEITTGLVEIVADPTKFH